MNGLTLIGIAVSLWSVGTGIIAKQFSVPALVWYPVAAGIAVLVTAGALYFKERSLRQLWPESKTARWLLLAIGMCVVFNNGLFFTGLQYASVPVALLTHYLAPLFLAVIFAPWLLNEKPTRREVLLTIIGFVGLIVVLWPDLSQARLNIGAILGALSAIFFAVGNVVNRKLTNYNIGGLAGAVYQNLLPAIVMAPWLIWFLASGKSFTGGDWLGVSYMGIVSIGAGFCLYLVGLQRVKKANHASIMTYGEPIGAIILSAIFLHEPMTAYVIIGGILIVGAGVALVVGERTSS